MRFYTAYGKYDLLFYKAQMITENKEKEKTKQKPFGGIGKIASEPCKRMQRHASNAPPFPLPQTINAFKNHQ